MDWKTYKETQYEKLAEIMRESLDMKYIYQIMGKERDCHEDSNTDREQGKRLAVTQTEIIKGQIEAGFPDVEVEIVTMKTTGDRILDRSLEQIGGKGTVYKRLDQALRDGRIDLSAAQPERYAHGIAGRSSDSGLQ